MGRRINTQEVTTDVAGASDLAPFSIKLNKVSVTSMYHFNNGFLHVYFDHLNLDSDLSS